MKKLFLSGAALLLASPAMAADLPMATKAPLAAPIPFTWTGCYAGVQAGYAWKRNDFIDPTRAVFADAPVATNSDGALLGGQLGCNYQFSSNWVIGIEGDWDWTNLQGNSDPFFGGKSDPLYSKTDSIASVTGRIGYAFNRWMIYGKGGAGFEHNRYSLTFPGFVLPPPIGATPTTVYNASEWQTGWVAGVGVEWAITDNWSTQIEYDHYDFGSHGVALAVSPPGAPPIAATINDHVDAVKLGLNYRFWAGR